PISTLFPYTTLFRSDHHEAVLFGPGRASGADLGARRILALLATDGDVEVALLGNFGRIVVGIGVGEVHAFLLLHRKDADPLNLRDRKSTRLNSSHDQ